MKDRVDHEAGPSSGSGKKGANLRPIWKHWASGSEMRASSQFVTRCHELSPGPHFRISVKVTIAQATHFGLVGPMKFESTIK